MSIDLKCATCEKTDDQTTLEKCPICFKYFCDEHALNYSGRRFCSKQCADYFFFADPDDY